MSSTMSRRGLLRGAAGLFGALSVSTILAACGSTAPAAPAATSKPAESKPATAASPAAPAAQPAATTAASPVAGASPAAGASPSPVASGAASAPVASKNFGNVQLRMHLRTGPEEDTMKAVLPKFKDDTGIDVKVETFATADYFVKVQTLLAGGTAGDVMWSIYRNTPRWGVNKVITQLDDLAKKDNFDFSRYWPTAVDACRYKGALYALPFKLHPGPAAVYYDVQQVTEGGVTVPDKGFATWDDLIASAKKLTKDGRWGFQMALTTDTTNTLQTVTMYLRSWGSDLYSEDGKTNLLNDQKSKDAITFMYDLINTQKVVPSARDFTTAGEDLFIAGRTSMLQAASSTKSVPTKIGGKFDVKNAVLPPGPGGLGTIAVTDHVVMNAKTTNPDASWELLKLLTSKDVGIRLGGGTGGTNSGTTGAMIEVFNDPSIMANPLHPIFVDLVKNAVPPRLPANLREEEVATALHQTLQPIFLGERKPDDAFFTELNGAVQRVLDQPPA
jgi:multiple sugar transport system substrate-binding protein